jgi:calcineurin-like phosphoesterase family protein
MTVWFTSDLHIGHRLVAGLRGFESTDDHDEAIFDRWDERVRKEDQVWVLGDLAVSKPDNALLELRGLPGVKHLVAGNHDPVHSMHRPR